MIALNWRQKHKLVGFFLMENLTSQAYPHTGMHICVQLLSVFLNCGQIDHLDAAGSHLKPNTAAAGESAFETTWRRRFVSLDQKRGAAEGNCWVCNRKESWCLDASRLSNCPDRWALIVPIWIPHVCNWEGSVWTRLWVVSLAGFMHIGPFFTRPEFHLH